jgi:hypothetical protein
MSMKFRTQQLTPAEASLITSQFGYHEDDDPYFQALWQAINRAWTSDHTVRPPGDAKTEHLKRLGSASAYPEEVAVYLKFKSDEGETYWLDLLTRAGLTDRRQRQVAPPVERRRRGAPSNSNK